MEDERLALLPSLNPSRPADRAFADTLRQRVCNRAVWREMHVETGEEPAVREYKIRETPTGLVYDRQGRLVARGATADEICAAVEKAAEVMRIDRAGETWSASRRWTWGQGISGRRSRRSWVTFRS